MKNLFISICFFVSNFLLISQQLSDTIFFDKGSVQVSLLQCEKTDSIPFNNLRLEGRTDKDGKSSYNLKLSEERVKAVQQLLIERGHKSQQIKIGFLGESKQLSLSSGLDKKRLNRCVIIYYEQEVLIKDLSELPEPAIQEYTFINNKGIHIELENGVIVDVEPHSFNTSSDDVVTFTMTSYMNKSDFILADLHSMAGEELLESAGMFFMEANVNQRAIDLLPSKSVDVQVPNKTKKEGFELFYGQNQPHHAGKRAVNWIHHSHKISSNIHFIAGGNFCLNKTEEKFSISRWPHRRPFGHPFRSQNYKAKYFRINKEKLGVALKPQRKPVKFQVNLFVSKGVLDSFQVINTEGELYRSCERKLHRVFKKTEWKMKKRSYGLTLDFDYGSMEGLVFEEDVVDSVSLEKASLDMITMSVTNMGWVNCDRFYGTSNKKQVNVKASPTTSVKLVFSRFNGIINGVYRRGSFSFGKIPVKEPYTVLSYKELSDGVLVAERSHNSKEKLTYRKMTRREFVQLLEKY